MKVNKNVIEINIFIKYKPEADNQWKQNAREETSEIQKAPKTIMR